MVDPAVDPGRTRDQPSGFTVCRVESKELNWRLLAKRQWPLALSLAFISGGRHRFRDRPLLASKAGLAVRAVLVLCLGLGLAYSDPGVAIILAYYGVMFLLAVPLLGLPPLALAALAVCFATIPPALAPAMFACSRVAGWSAHILEQKRTGRLIRPSAKYVGPSERKAEDVEGWNPDWATDGNAATDQDAGWLPLLANPPYPEHPSGHLGLSGSIVYTLRAFFGTAPG